MTANDIDAEPVYIRLYVDTGFVGAMHEEHIAIDRIEWDAMTPAERRTKLDDEAERHMEDVVEFGWEIEDPDDFAATEDGAA